MSDENIVEVETYLVISAKSSYANHYVHNGTKVFKNKPNTNSGEIALKLKLNIPKSLFMKPQLNAVINIPEPDTRPLLSIELQDEISEIIRNETGFKVSISCDTGVNDEP